MGAAIPIMLTVVTSLKHILPAYASRMKTEVKTGTTELLDELVPEDEDEETTTRSRHKSTLSVVVKIDGGDDPVPEAQVSKKNTARNERWRAYLEKKRAEKRAKKAKKEGTILARDSDEESVEV